MLQKKVRNFRVQIRKNKLDKMFKKKRIHMENYKQLQKITNSLLGLSSWSNNLNYNIQLQSVSNQLNEIYRILEVMIEGKSSTIQEEDNYFVQYYQNVEGSTSLQQNMIAPCHSLQPVTSSNFIRWILKVFEVCKEINIQINYQAYVSQKDSLQSKEILTRIMSIFSLIWQSKFAIKEYFNIDGNTFSQIMQILQESFLTMKQIKIQRCMSIISKQEKIFSQSVWKGQQQQIIYKRLELYLNLVQCISQILETFNEDYAATVQHIDKVNLKGISSKVTYFNTILSDCNIQFFIINELQKLNCFIQRIHSKCEDENEISIQVKQRQIMTVSIGLQAGLNRLSCQYSTFLRDVLNSSDNCSKLTQITFLNCKILFQNVQFQKQRIYRQHKQLQTEQSAEWRSADCRSEYFQIQDQINLSWISLLECNIFIELTTLFLKQTNVSNGFTRVEFCQKLVQKIAFYQGQSDFSILWDESSDQLLHSNPQSSYQLNQSNLSSKNATILNFRHKFHNCGRFRRFSVLELLIPLQQLIQSESISLSQLFATSNYAAQKQPIKSQSILQIFIKTIQNGIQKLYSNNFCQKGENIKHVTIHQCLYAILGYCYLKQQTQIESQIDHQLRNGNCSGQCLKNVPEEMQYWNLRLTASCKYLSHPILQQNRENYINLSIDDSLAPFRQQHQQIPESAKILLQCIQETGFTLSNRKQLMQMSSIKQQFFQTQI